MPGVSEIGPKIRKAEAEAEAPEGFCFVFRWLLLHRPCFTRGLFIKLGISLLRCQETAFAFSDEDHRCTRPVNGNDSDMDNPVETNYDVVVIGAGLSGINTAYRLQTELPSASFVVLDSRDVVGGTWAFWKYPGARSDSSLATFGLRWHPWPHDNDFASAASIQAYLKDAADAKGITRHIKLRHRVGPMDWSTEEQRWTLGVEDLASGAKKTFRAGWVISCGGYYDYEKPLPAVIPGIESFGGKVVHPQSWTDDVVYEGKKVVIIGSGATSVTLLPSIAEKAAQVTMLQRSPSFVMALPAKDRITRFLKRWLPLRWAVWVDWYRRIFLEVAFVRFLHYFPQVGRRRILALTKKALPVGYPVDVHFNPRYNPFEQRLCMCPDGDFFKVLHRDNCRIVTDAVDTVTEKSIRLKSGEELEAELIITATGLYLSILAGLSPSIDGKPFEVAGRYAWRSCMLEGIPNLSLIIGYSKGTWTPGADVHARTVFSVMNHMKKIGATSVRPKVGEKERAKLARWSVLDVTSTYVTAALDRMPVSGGRYPWMAGKNWLQDAFYNLFGNPKDGMEYTVPVKAA